MSFVPPHPGKSAQALREQLEQVRLLVQAYPNEPAYPAAAEYLEAAIAKLESVPPPEQTA